MPWRISLFGKVSARRETVEDRFSTRKTAELLGYLAINPGARFSRKHLCDVLWPFEDDMGAARLRLRQAIYSIRRQLEPRGAESESVVLTEHDLVWLNPLEAESDVAEFQSLLALLGTCPPDRLRAHLNRILELHRVEFMADIPAEWIAAEQDVFDQSFLNAADVLADLYFKDGDWLGAVEALNRAVEIDPYDEARCGLLMTAYRNQGLAGDALVVYEELRGRLGRDLGLKPSAEITRLAQSIRAEAGPGQQPHRSVRVLPRGENERRGRRFPVPGTRFYGRSQEMATLQSMIATPGTRLITLLGPGGAGKTRLALELAEKLYFERSGSVWFVPLADLGMAQEIAGAIASALEADSVKTGSTENFIIGCLSEHDDPVLVLDNFEHLVEEGSRLVSDLLDGVPNLRCITTSRQSLELAGEQKFLVEVLGIPPASASTRDEILSYSAVQMFFDRAKLARPDFQITPGNASAVAELCRKLEGVPLAIEIAAALIQSVTPARMVAGLSNRFELLINKRKDVVARHRSLRATVEYSYGMLPCDLPFIFRQLAIFQGGWTAESAAGLLGIVSVHESLRQLQERSLIAGEEIWLRDQPTIRFRMMDASREFALENLTSEEKEGLAGAHQAYFSEFVRIQRDNYFKDQNNVDELAIEFANIAGAIRWCIADNRVSDGMDLCTRLYHFWMVKGRYEEGAYWCSLVADAPGAETVDVRTRCLAERCLMHFVICTKKIGEALPYIDRHAALAEEAGDLAEIAHSHSCQAIYFFAAGERAKALELGERALREARETEGEMVGPVLMDLLNLRYQSGNYEKTVENCAEAYEIALTAGARLNACRATGMWARSLGMLGRFEEAEQKFEESLIAAKNIGAPNSVMTSRLGVAALRLIRGEWDAGRRCVAESIKENPNLPEISLALHLAGYIAASCDKDFEMAALLSQAAALIEDSESSHFVEMGSDDPLFRGLNADVEVLKHKLGAKYAAICAEAKTLKRSDTVRIALRAMAATADLATHEP